MAPRNPIQDQPLVLYGHIMRATDCKLFGAILSMETEKGWWENRRRERK